ncbi:hypothetical protein TRVA0_006S00452 [Trichomonascus vanleenenianus]|uniref:beta-glucosidase n=1 Tax=Trichomonascus vanleenenianus TaxID=2268995 RepID=UPI003ECAA071
MKVDVAATLSMLVGASVAQQYINSIRNSTGVPKDDSPLAYSPPVYPSLQGGRTHDEEWESAYEKARAFVSQLTVPEKVNLTTGIGWEMGLCVGNTGDLPDKDFLGLCLQDGPLGVRMADLVTGNPSGIAAGATFNKQLIYERGNAIGAEHKAKGVDIMLGPVVGPLGSKAQDGRIWESFGADPYLQGVAAAHTVQGIQDNGIMANGKHFIMNEQELYRNTISSNVNDRALHELYAWPFADIVHAGVGSIMCSYNLINNSYGCENSKLLNGILKDELGFQGFVMSDWEALRSGIGSAIAGADMDMPGGGLGIPMGTSFWGFNLTQSIVNGSLPIERLDDMATRIMAAYYKVNLDQTRAKRQAMGEEGPNFSSWTQADEDYEFTLVKQGDIITVNKHVDVRTEQSRKAAYQVAVEAITLLRNENNSLPLNEKNLPKKIGILGLAAGPAPDGPICAPDLGCSEGALAGGWGSGQVNIPYQITPFEAINWRAIKAGSAVSWNFDSGVTDLLTQTATNSDLNIVFGLTDSGEGYITVDGNEGDRKNATLWHGADEVIAEALRVNRNNIIVISSVGPVNLETFIEHENCTAVLFTLPSGQDSGQAISDVLFGDHNPSGRLPFTIALDDSDYLPLFNSSEVASNSFPQDDTFLDADIYVDYRHFDHYGIEPRFEFGFGLSYSEFEFCDLYLKPVNPPAERLPTPGMLKPVYQYNSTVPRPEDVLFPSTWNRIRGFLYPYLNTTAQGEPSGPGYPYPEGYSEEQPAESSIAGGYSGGNKALWEVAYKAVVKLTNKGEYAGQYVPQLYIGYPQSDKWPTPPRQLRGFEKIELAPGQLGQVQFDILTRDISVWDVESQQWIIPRGTYTVYVGSSSRSLELMQTFTL